MMATKKFNHSAVIVTSDTCSIDPSKDVSGEYVVKELEKQDFIVAKHIVEDDQKKITKLLSKLLLNKDIILIITVGGTGLCPRDVTPEATSALYDKNCTGIVAAFHMNGLRYSPHAALSRLTAGIADKCLIINFPGKLQACKQCFGCLEGFLTHALDQVKFNAEAIAITHARQDATLVEPLESSDEEQNIKTTTSDSFSHLESLSKRELKATQSRQESPVIMSIVQKCESNIMHQDPAIIEAVIQGTKSLKLESPYAMIEYTRALSLMKPLSRELHQGSLDIVLNSQEAAFSVLGEITASDIYSKSSIPSFPVSMVDGYVLNIPSALRNFVPSIGTVQAQLVRNYQYFEELQKSRTHASSFFCYQVNTGGRVPENNIAIVPIEKTGPISMKNNVPIYEIKLDRFIRLPGSDLDTRASIKAGTIIGPVELGLIQAMQQKVVKLVKKPTIGVLSTGDELVDYFSTSSLKSSEVVDTNGPLISALFRRKGYPVMSCGIAKDDPTQILAKIQSSLVSCNVLLITGGASMGSKDYVKEILNQIGTIHFGRVNIKPGKPAAFASVTVGGRKKFIFSLPGNPVSAYITSLVLVLPFLEHGIRNHSEIDSHLTLTSIGDMITVEIGSITDLEDSHVYEFDGRLDFVRAKISLHENNKLNSPYRVVVSAKQQSSRLLNLLDCDCLIMIDPSLKGSKFQVGQIYPALRLRS